MRIKFYKYQGTGNDFILFDNRSGQIDHKNNHWFRQLCDRRFGIGADGIMLLENEAGCDFKMVYYNADGNESSMCGNGGRCIVNFAFGLGIKKSKYIFKAIDGLHEAIIDSGIVHLKMNDVPSVEKNADGYFLDTGSPHLVAFVSNLDEVNVLQTGSTLRYDDRYSPGGTNINFVAYTNNAIQIRTYERGVEDETLSCGTGVTAAAIVCGVVQNLPEGDVTLKLATRGGELTVKYKKHSDGSFTDIWLIGPGELVFEGEVDYTSYSSAASL